MWRGVIMQKKISFNTCPNWCLSAPLLKQHENKSCLVLWADLNTKPDILFTMPKQELMTCLLPSPKGIWKCGPRYKFGRRFRVGMSSKSNCQDSKWRPQGRQGRQERGGEELHCASLCPWLQYALEIYTLHNSTNLLVSEQGGPT